MFKNLEITQGAVLSASSDGGSAHRVFLQLWICRHGGADSINLNNVAHSVKPIRCDDVDAPLHYQHLLSRFSTQKGGR